MAAAAYDLILIQVDGSIQDSCSPFRASWRSVVAAAYDLILIQVDGSAQGNCQFVVDNLGRGGVGWDSWMNWLSRILC